MIFSGLGFRFGFEISRVRGFGRNGFFDLDSPLVYKRRDAGAACEGERNSSGGRCEAWDTCATSTSGSKPYERFIRLGLQGSYSSEYSLRLEKGMAMGGVREMCTHPRHTARLSFESGIGVVGLEREGSCRDAKERRRLGTGINIGHMGIYHWVLHSPGIAYPAKQRIQVAGREQEFWNVVGSYSRASETLRGRERKILRERLVHAAASVVVTVAEMGQVLRELRYVNCRLFVLLTSSTSPLFGWTARWALAACCPGVFGCHSACTQATESTGIVSPSKFESAPININARLCQHATPPPLA
ncbi:hypothetical protein B0H13DRAFT_1907272 [Mycena leptocephala]|nr:hypothetical protein B0H13DRAFT_1907272 [Mycena leptocephala]